MAANNVDSTLAVIGSDERSYRLNLNLLEILKVIEGLPTAINLGGEGGGGSSSWLLTICIIHGTLYESRVNFNWCQLCSVEHAKNAHVVPEAFTSYLYVLRRQVVFRANWTTLRERSEIRIVAEDELVLSVVFAIEGKVYVDLVATAPAGWRGALHRLIVYEEGGHHAHWRIILIHCFSLGGRVWYLSEAAKYTLHRIRNIRELGASQPDLRSSDDTATLGLNIGELRPLVVAELKASVLPVDSIQ